MNGDDHIDAEILESVIAATRCPDCLSCATIDVDSSTVEVNHDKSCPQFAAMVGKSNSEGIVVRGVLIVGLGNRDDD